MYDNVTFELTVRNNRSCMTTRWNRSRARVCWLTGLSLLSLLTENQFWRMCKVFHMWVKYAALW